MSVLGPHLDRIEVHTEYLDSSPSRRWACARLFGEQFNNHLRRSVVGMLQREGYAAAASVLTPTWERTASKGYGLVSTWSERHTAIICVLGTFRLCKRRDYEGHVAKGGEYEFTCLVEWTCIQALMLCRWTH